jgi:hypothetical protein
VERLSISNFPRTASITEYWQGMMSDLIDFLDLIHQSTVFFPQHSEFRNCIGVVWWYYLLLLICGEVEYIRLPYNSWSHHLMETGMIPDLMYLLVLIHQRTVYCPRRYEFRNFTGVAWWYYSLQLVSGELEYIKL